MPALVERSLELLRCQADPADATRCRARCSSSSAGRSGQPAGRARLPRRRGRGGAGRRASTTCSTPWRRVEALAALKTQAGLRAAGRGLQAGRQHHQGRGRHPAATTSCSRPTASGPWPMPLPWPRQRWRRRWRRATTPRRCRRSPPCAPPVDAFFDGVMVMAEQPEIRSNRLALLTEVGRLFDGIADFAKIAHDAAILR
ncbi:MAG: hypothetical protein MZV49_14765 [Rhodopseudomonas palustris]|nr:hypothetical protein [Rhodopseudomonas palustris]